MNVLNNLPFGSGCRCCYDPESDGGEYAALIEARRIRQEEQQQQEKIDQNNDDINEPNHTHETSSNTNSNSDSDSDSDSEFDYLLDEDLPNTNDSNTNSTLYEMEQNRRTELHLQALLHESAQHHGYGTHRQMHPNRVLRAAGLGVPPRDSSPASRPPAVVLHLYDPESSFSASLDLCLEEMAGSTFRGTKFLRGSGRTTLSFQAELVAKVLPSLRLESDLPALLAVRDGDVVAICPNLSGLGNEKDGVIEPRAVEEWLGNAGVLRRDLPFSTMEDMCRIRPEEIALHENMIRERKRMEEIQRERERERIYSCGVPGCRKEFQHQHVGIRNEEQDGLILCQDIAVGPTES